MSDCPQPDYLLVHAQIFDTRDFFHALFLTREVRSYSTLASYVPVIGFDFFVVETLRKFLPTWDVRRHKD
jgi:hypothetical protein